MLIYWRVIYLIHQNQVSFVLPETVSPLISANETENATILTTTLEASSVIG